MTGWLPRYPRWLRVFTAGAVVAAVMAGSAAAKAANYFNGNQLYEACSRASNVGDFSFCQGYVAGIAAAMSNGDTIYKRRACVPEDAELLQVMLVVWQFLSAHPETGDLRAAGLVAQALAGAFPCKK